MNKEEKINTLKNMLNCYLHATNLTNKEMEESEKFVDELEAAISVTHCCTELPTSTQLLSDCKNRFKDLKENNYKFDYRSYQNGYLDSFSKYAVSKKK
jgi:hypothetical protein